MQGPKNKLIIDRNRPIMERLDALEKFLSEFAPAITDDQGRIAKGVQDAVDKLQFINSKTAEVLEAVITALGPEFAPKLEVSAKKNREDREERVASIQKAQVAESVANGKLKSVTSVSEKTLIVGREFKNSELVHPGYQQVEFSGVDQKLKEILLGKEVGYKVEVPEDNSYFEITELYEAVEDEPKGVKS